MSTLLIVVIVVVAAVIVVGLLAVLLPGVRNRRRARARERALVQRRTEVAGAHRQTAQARDREAQAAEQRARIAEQEAATRRAEAQMHQERARLYEQGLADDDLDGEQAPDGDVAELQDRDETYDERHATAAGARSGDSTR
jgi:uncharacterized protein HemX